MASLAYCFTVSSFVSFSGYFHSSLLPGNRFLSLFSMGLLKLLLGMIPFACGSYLGRRPILLTSIAVAMLCSSALTFMLSSTQFSDTDYVSFTSVFLLFKYLQVVMFNEGNDVISVSRYKVRRGS